MERLFLTPKISGKIKKNISQIAKSLKNVKLKLENNTLSIEGNSLDEYNSLNVIKAISCGFDLKESSLLKNEEFMIEEVRIKDYVKSSNRLRQVKARVIGAEGRALKTISLLSDCFIQLSDNSVFIIGQTEDVKIAMGAIISLIKGSRHANIYSRLEHKPDFGDDFALKEPQKE